MYSRRFLPLQIDASNSNQHKEFSQQSRQIAKLFTSPEVSLVAKWAIQAPHKQAVMMARL